MAKVLRHVVLFAFKDSASEADVQGVVDRFLGLKDEIDGVLSMDGGKDVSNEGLQDGFTHAFTVTWKDEDGRAAFGPHPAHQAFIEETLSPHLEKVVVVDYWGDDGS